MTIPLYLDQKNSSAEVEQSTHDPMDEGSNPGEDKIAKNDAFFHDEKKVSTAMACTINVLRL